MKQWGSECELWEEKMMERALTNEYDFSLHHLDSWLFSWGLKKKMLVRPFSRQRQQCLCVVNDPLADVYEVEPQTVWITKATQMYKRERR